MQLFNLYVLLKFFGRSLMHEMQNEASEMADHYPEATWLSQVLPPGNVAIGNSRPAASLFHKAQRHLSDDQAAVFTITSKLHYHNISIDTAANLFNIPDLCAALGDKFLLEQTYAECHGQCRSAPNVHLPFSHLHVWHNFRMRDQCSHMWRGINHFPNM